MRRVRSFFILTARNLLFKNQKFCTRKIDSSGNHDSQNISDFWDDAAKLNKYT